MAGASPSWGSGSPIRNTTRDGALPHRPSAESFELPACEAPPDPTGRRWRCTARLATHPAISPTFYVAKRSCKSERSTPTHSACCGRGARSWGCKLAQTYHVDRKMLVASGLVNFRPELEGIRFGHLLESIARWSDGSYKSSSTRDRRLGWTTMNAAWSSHPRRTWSISPSITSS
jgi:hypothetical protein